MTNLFLAFALYWAIGLGHVVYWHRSEKWGESFQLTSVGDYVATAVFALFWPFAYLER